jgi:hypothetical protein
MGHATSGGILTKKGIQKRACWIDVDAIHTTHSRVHGTALHVELDDQFDTSFDSEDIFAPPRL